MANTSQPLPATAMCSCYSCDQPANVIGAFSPDKLCDKHAALDTKHLMAYREGVLRNFQKATQAFRTRAKRRKLCNEALRAFDEARDLLACGLREALNAIGNCDEEDIAEERRMTELMTYEAEDAAAMASNNLAEVHRLARRMDLALGEELSETASAAAAAAAESLKNAQEASIRWDSVCRSLAELVHDFLKPLSPTSSNNEAAVAADSALFVESTVWDQLPGDVMWVTACGNTVDYWADADGVAVVAAANSPTGRPLAPLCLFASLHFSHQTDHLLALGSDGSRLLVRAQIDWKERVRGLHCDSVRQRLFISQDSAGVAACDLAGNLLFRLSLPSPLSTAGLTGSTVDQRLLVFDELGRRVLSVVMDENRGWHCRELAVGHCHSGSFGRLAVGSDGCVLLTDYASGRLHRLCPETGLSLEWLSPEPPSRPVSVAVDAAGRVFVSYTESHVIDVHSPDGAKRLGRLSDPAISQSGAAAARPLESPCGLAVWPTASRGLTWLAVAERDARRVRLFLVAC